jgi:hypothetical protein
MDKSRLVILLLVLTSANAASAASGWVSLFNGQNFEGWTFDVLDDSPPHTIWKIQEGTLVARGQGKAKSVIRTLETFADYELTFEWRWFQKPGNSGCLLHCSKPRRMSVWPQSLEVQLAHGNAGDFIMIGESIEVKASQIPQVDESSWEVRRRIKLTDGAEKPAGQWNRMHIVARDSTVTVVINGQPVNRCWNVSAKRGAICLQAEKADVQFRHIQIKKIPAPQ